MRRGKLRNQGQCQGEARVILFVAFGGGVVVVVAEVELEADAARDLGEFHGVGGIGSELVAFVISDGDGVKGVFGESAAGVDHVFARRPARPSRSVVLWPSKNFS